MMKTWSIKTAGVIGMALCAGVSAGGMAAASRESSEGHAAKGATEALQAIVQTRATNHKGDQQHWDQGRRDPVQVDLEVRTIVSTAKGDRLVLGADVSSNLDGVSGVSYRFSVYSIDGTEVKSQTPEALSLAANRSVALDGLEVPEGLADGYYHAQLSVAWSAEDVQHDGDSVVDVFFSVAEGRSTVVDPNEYDLNMLGVHTQSDEPAGQK